MTSVLAPHWAIAAEAVDGVGDTHLPLGVHVRALPSPALGIPATPLAVYRAVLNPDAIKRSAHTNGVIWIDSNGANRTVPFTVTPDNPVYGYFPLPDVIYAQLLATPARQPVPGVHTVAEFADLIRQPAVLARTPVSPFARPAVLMDYIDRATAAVNAMVGTPASLRFEALANSEYGPAPFASRSAAPYAIASWTIPLVRVVGSGTVQGMLWINAAVVKEIERDVFWELWSLPVDPAPRYVPTATAKADALARVGRAGAKRQPMYVAYGSASPGSAPAAVPNDAVKRVDQVRVDLDRWLHILLNDLSHPTSALVDTQNISGNNGTAAIPIEPFVIAGSVDPDVGHHLGFGDVDQKPPAAPGSIVIYRVRGLWRWIPSQWNPVKRTAFTAAVRADLDAAVLSFPELKQFNIVPKEKGPFVDLHSFAVARFVSRQANSARTPLPRSPRPTPTAIARCIHFRRLAASRLESRCPRARRCRSWYRGRRMRSPPAKVDSKIVMRPKGPCSIVSRRAIGSVGGADGKRDPRRRNHARRPCGPRSRSIRIRRPSRRRCRTVRCRV